MMRILTKHQKPLERLTTEAVKILDLSRGPPESDLNGKSEWGQPRIPKLNVNMPGEKRPATIGADPDNQPLQYYLAQLELGQGTKSGKIGKVKIAWRQTGDTDDETAERDHKRQKLDHYTQPQITTPTELQAQNTENTQSEAQTLPQQIHSPHKTHSPQTPALKQKDTPTKLNTPVAVKIKRWEDKNKGEKEKSRETTREDNKREGEKDEQDRNTNEETNKTKKDTPNEGLETGSGGGLSSPEGKNVGITGGVK